MFFGSLGRVFHWGPLTALSIIKCISFMTVHCGNMWWPPSESWGGLISNSFFLIFSSLTVFNFLCAIYAGPGYLPLNWQPENPNDVRHLQYCAICQGYKAPRSHHCRKCGRCVQKMDHHCPWINNCVGYLNHGHFTTFLYYAVLGCIQASIILSCSLYRGLNRTYEVYYGVRGEPVVTLNVYTLVFCVFSLGLAIGVVLAVGMLLFFQLRAVFRNRTAIEDWIVEKANHRRYVDNEPPFVYPYDLGLLNNVGQVLNFTCSPLGDGIDWPVVDGCDQYTLTLEQQRQKDSKRQRTRAYEAVRHFSGWWFPVVHGWRVMCHPPFTDEPRIQLQPGDTVLVTRWRKYWLFGEKVQQAGKNGARIRGWFPRCCTVEVDGGINTLEDKDK